MTFAKVLGTSSARFVPTAATPTRWVALACGDADAVATETATQWWRRNAVESADFSLVPLQSRGRWDGAIPFTPGSARAWTGPVLVLTRATLRANKARRFYRAVPAIAAGLASAPDCVAALGIGESPLLRQGTLTVWRSAAAIDAFAHGHQPHVQAIRDTGPIGWYAEELFARFAVVAATGSIDGRPLP
jgi:hypothetical protein